jgi:electron transfer flavoprotein alpha subunit
MSVLVYTESEKGKFKKAAFEVVSYAKAIADKMGTEVTAVAINANDPDSLANYGAVKVLTVTDSGLDVFNAKKYAAVIEAAAKEVNASVVVIRFKCRQQIFGSNISSWIRGWVCIKCR